MSRHVIAGPRWAPVARGVHVEPGTDVQAARIRLETVAALLPAGAAIGGWAALHRLGVTDLDGRCGPGARELLPVPVCVGPSARIRPRPGLIVLDRRRLPGSDVIEVDGVRVTRPERAVVDIARCAGIEDGVVAADAAARFGVMRPAALRAYVLTHPPHAGPAQRPHCGPARVRGRGLMPGEQNAGDLSPRGRAAGAAGERFRGQRPERVAAGYRRPGRPRGGTGRGVRRRRRCDLERHTADNAREEALEGVGLVVVRATAIDIWTRRAQLVRRLRDAHSRGLARDRSRDRWVIRHP